MAIYYRHIFNLNFISKILESLNNHNCTAFNERWSNYVGDELLETNSIDVELLDKVISDLKLGKATGMDNLSAEHFKYSHPVVLLLLLLLV